MASRTVLCCVVHTAWSHFVTWHRFVF